jgi:outer membrane immunogenic protein
MGDFDMRICKAIPLVAPILLGAAAILSVQTARADTPGVYASATSPGFFDRTGWYIGAAIGGAFNPGVNNWDGNGFTSEAVGRINRLIDNHGNSGAVTGGIYGGYQYKWADIPLVTGLEADFNGLGDLAKNSSGTYIATGAGFAPAGRYTVVSGRDTNFFGTIRTHIGYVPNPQTEIFLSSGFAYAGNSGSKSGSVYYTNPVTGVTTGFTRNGSNSAHTGFAVGGGFSYAFMENLAARVEGMYIDLKSNDHTFYPPGGGAYSIEDQFKFHFTVVRAGLTYKF